VNGPKHQPLTPNPYQPMPGHYAKKQLLSPSKLIAWSHSRRFATGLSLARRFAGQRVVDYGCGDGTFLELLLRGPGAPRAAVGVEITDELVRDCTTRLGHVAGLSFARVEELDRAEHAAAYDGVVCMEVLEHVVDVEEVLDRLVRLLAPGGTLIVSVPVETGLALPVKQTARRIAGWRGIGDYPGTTPYTLRELAAGVFAGGRQHVSRPVHLSPDGTRFHDHKGFNWRALRQRLRRRLRVERTLASPLAWLPPGLASQVWLLARRAERDA